MGCMGGNLTLWLLLPKGYHLVWATELLLAAIGLIFPVLVLGYIFFIVESMTYQFRHRLKI
jgi:hypothetical protein